MVVLLPSSDGWHHGQWVSSMLGQFRLVHHYRSFVRSCPQLRVGAGWSEGDLGDQKAVKCSHVRGEKIIGYCTHGSTERMMSYLVFRRPHLDSEKAIESGLT
jgi:hypothetical protein